MRLITTAPLSLVLAAAAQAADATAARRGIYTEDLDRSVDACTDFFEFANGKWRRENPIPRRW